MHALKCVLIRQLNTNEHNMDVHISVSEYMSIYEEGCVCVTVKGMAPCVSSKRSLQLEQLVSYIRDNALSAN